MIVINLDVSNLLTAGAMLMNLSVTESTLGHYRSNLSYLGWWDYLLVTGTRLVTAVSLIPVLIYIIR